MLARYRRTGADPPFGDPRAYHGVAMEGYFWRFTDADAGIAIVVFAAVNRPPSGAPWTTVGLAAHPGGFARAQAVDHAEAGGPGLRLRAVDGGRVALAAQERSLCVDLGPDARLDVALSGEVPWPRRPFGGIGAAQLLPGLSQYWHPWLLHARAAGTALLGTRTVTLRGAPAYAEKSWGAGGFPRRWWWGEAHDFPPGDVSVAFAGGDARALRVPLTASSVVVRVGREVVRVTGPPARLRAPATGDGTWRLEGRGVRHAVVVEGSAAGSSPHRLPVPIPAERRHAEGVAAQYLAGELRVTLRRGRRTVYSGASPLAGLESGGA